jgi:signal transduction histidine kinase/response regulator RpfG family c-di-GMP phosphodiesterase
MMMLQSIITEGVVTAVLPMTVVLGSLILFALWTGRAASRGEMLLPLLASFSAFIVSRLIGSELGTIVLFSLLNYIGYLFLALAVMKLVDTGAATVTGEDGDNAVEHAGARLAHSFPRLIRHSIYMGLVGAIAFFLVGSRAGLPVTYSTGVANFFVIGATIRIIAFVLHAVRLCPPSLRVTAYAGVGLLSASWLMMQEAPLLPPGTFAVTSALSPVFDMATMVLVLAGLISDYVRLGDRFRARSSKDNAAMKEAQAELAKVNNLATNIYEDSSDLIMKQKEQTLQFMKKVENLEKILQIGIRIQKRQHLDEVMRMIVEMVRDDIGFKTVTLRLLNEKTQNFETMAYVGLSEEVRETVVNYRIPVAEYKKIINPQLRMSKSYFIRNSSPWYGEDLSDGSMIVEDTWGDIDMLIVPLSEDGNDTIGYLSVENPENPKLSIADILETMENVAVLAAIAIRNARFFKELEGKNTKLRGYADKLSSLNKMKSNFVATISHEFRTPLTSIKAYCETLLKNADEVDRDLLKQFLIVIDEESSRLMTLIDDILDFSQLESGAMKFERKPTKLVAVIETAVKELEKNFALKQVQLHQDLPDADLVMQVDGELIKQLIVNLLHNAAKFTKEAGNVWLRVTDEPSAIHITVQDDGIGIPDAQLSQIFEEFHQADSSNTRRHGGSGLGLAICKNIVEWHDGRIWVENVSGYGARFVAVIPKKQVVVKCHMTRVSSTIRRFEIERFLELLVENIAVFMKIRKASIMLIDHEREELRIESAIGIDEDIVADSSVKLGEGIAGRVALSGQTMFVENIETDQRTERSNNELVYGSKAFMSVPIKVEDKVVGVVNASSPIDRDSFDEHDAHLLETLSERFALALGKLVTFADASVSYEHVRDTFKSILEAKRYIDRQDDDIIQAWVMRSAEKLGLDEAQRERLRYVLNVYDLGLSKVGYHIVKKPHDLSPNDRLEIEKHTVIGRDLLDSIETEPDVGKIVLYHHENFDGSGYPGQLKGDAIPIESRILRVSDSLRALISQRPYQRQYSIEEAKEVIRHRSGTFFDPEVADVFIEVMEESVPVDPSTDPHSDNVLEEKNS